MGPIMLEIELSYIFTIWFQIKINLAILVIK